MRTRSRRADDPASSASSARVSTRPFGTGTVTLNGGQMRSGNGAPTTVLNSVVISADTTFYTTGAEKSLTFNGPVTLTGGTRTIINAPIKAIPTIALTKPRRTLPNRFACMRA